MKKNRKYYAARAWFGAGLMFNWACPRCGGNSLTMSDVCPALLEEICPGFCATEQAYKVFEENYEALRNGPPESTTER
jgi:hypothetical protein